MQDKIMRALKTQLKQLKSAHNGVNPDHLWVEENKKRLMLQITNTVGAAPEVSTLVAIKKFIKTFVPSNVLRFLRPVFTVAMVLVLAIAGWGASVSASFNSLPGDVLWNVKVAAEKTQIAFAGSKEEKIKKQLEFAERRVEEVKMVFEKGDKSTDKHRSAAKKELEKVKESVKDVVKTADETVRDTVKTDPTKAVQLALVVENRADNIVAGLDQLKEVADKTGDKELVQQVVKTAKETSETAYIPVQSVLEASTQPEVVTDQKVQQEVKQIVTEKLQGVLEDTEKVKQKLQTDISATSTKNMTIEIVSSTLPVEIFVNTSTSVLKSVLDRNATGDGKTKAETIAPVPQKVVNEVTEKTREVEESAQEVRGLIEEGRLNEALDRIKSLNQITNDAEAILITQPNATTTENAGRVQENNTSLWELSEQDQVSG